MNWNFLQERFRPTPRGTTASFALPAVVLEIEPDFVAGVRLDRSARSPRRVQRIGVREFEARILEPLPNRPNITNEAGLREALRAVANVIGNGADRLGLLVSDATVRVGTLSFETLPDDPRETEALVRWKMRENLPCAPEEARVSYQVTWREPGRVELMAVAAKSSVLAEYELALSQMNGGPALILPATAALLPLLPEGEEGGQLLVHVCSGWVTTAVVEGSRLRSWRTRQVGRAAPEDLVRDVVSEATRVLASACDHMHVEVRRVWICARPPASAELVPELVHALSQEVVNLTPSADLAAALPDAERTLFERFGATVAGLILNAK